MRARNMLASVVLMFVTVFTGHADAIEDDALVLEGVRTASIDITLASDTTFDLERLAMNGSGRFVGFYAEALDVPVASRSEPGRHLGAVQIRDWRAPGQPGLTLSFAPERDNTLRAGRYRLYLLADGQSTVRIPTMGSLDRHLRPAKPATANVAADSDILTSQFNASNVQPLRLSGTRSVPPQSQRGVWRTTRRRWLRWLHAQSAQRCGPRLRDRLSTRGARSRCLRG
jgi:hypothetical protein